ncbi:MAG: hypothetical protein CL398_03475 [Acidiferrobacteraceae bacterium]|nr:hypothetical protein [Acidiferrobacteraceae bacterium]
MPLWVVTLIVLLGLLFTATFGWAVRHVVSGYDRLGRMGPVVVAVASFPELIEEALYATGLMTIQLDEEDDQGRRPPQIIDNPFPSVDKFRKNGVIQDGFRLDAGYLLLPVYNPSINSPTAQLIRLDDQSIVHSWVPKHIPHPNRSRVELWHPILLDDGGLIFHWHSDQQNRIDVCGNLVWEIVDNFHHSNEIGLDETHWVPKHGSESYREKLYQYQDADITQISQTGEVLFEQSVTELLAEHGYRSFLLGMSLYTGDQIHLNDIQPALYSTDYWEKGDLLLSFRELSTVALYRPKTNKILWMKTGPWIRQHDPDFFGESKISVFGNDYVRGNSLGQSLINGHNNVYVYDLKDGSITTPYTEALVKADVRTWERGLHRILDNGDLFVEESNRGRILRLSQDDVIWEYTPKTSDSTVAMPTWSRYLTAEEIDHVLPILDSSNCK